MSEQFGAEPLKDKTAPQRKKEIRSVSPEKQARDQLYVEGKHAKLPDLSEAHAERRSTFDL